MLKNAIGIRKKHFPRRFRALFGVTPKTTAYIWNKMGAKIPATASPQHLLWAFLFLKVYSSENVHAIIAGVDEKTFRKWAWTFVNLIASLDLVSLEVGLFFVNTN